MGVLQSSTGHTEAEAAYEEEDSTSWGTQGK